MPQIHHIHHISIYSSNDIWKSVEDLISRCAGNFLKNENVPICHCNSDSVVKTWTREVATVVGRRSGRKGGSTFPRNKLFFSGKIGGAKRHKYWQTTTINSAGMAINVDQVRERFRPRWLARHDVPRYIHRSIIISVRCSQR